MYLNLPGHFCLSCCEFKSGHMCIDGACVLCCGVHLNATTCVCCARWDICIVCCGVHLNACCAQWDICGTLEPAMRHTLPGNWGASHWNSSTVSSTCVSNLVKCKVLPTGIPQLASTVSSTWKQHITHRTFSCSTVFQIWCKSVKCKAAVRHC